MITKDKVSVTIPEPLAATVREQAAREHRSFSGQVAYFLDLAVGHKSTQEHSPTDGRTEVEEVDTCS